jgi:putative transposase
LAPSPAGSRSPHVERSLAWYGRNRRLAKDVETLIASSTAMLHLAATRLLTRRLATP